MKLSVLLCALLCWSGCVGIPKTPQGKVRAAEVVFIHTLDSLTFIRKQGNMSDEVKREVLTKVKEIDLLFDILDKNPKSPRTLQDVNTLIRSLTEILIDLEKKE